MEHFKAAEADNLMFCHRWLLLCFKREFVFQDALRMFEILCSHHLELNSIEAAKARDTEIRKERERETNDAADGVKAEGECGVRQRGLRPSHCRRLPCTPSLSVRPPCTVPSN